MKFRSLIFREFKLSKKIILLQLLLLLLMIVMTWGVVFSTDSDTPEEQSLTMNTIIISVALISTMPLLLDDIFKSDINSGWLNYSYALPITPVQRTAVCSVRRGLMCLPNILFSLCNAEALSVFRGEGFSINYVVWHIIVIAAVMIFLLPNNIIVLRARNAEEIKKKQQTAGLITAVTMAVIIIAVFRVSGIDLENISDSDANIALPEFTALSLAWSVPLMIVMIAANLFARYFSMRSASFSAHKTQESNRDNVFQAASSQNGSADNSSIAAIPQNGGETTGFLYKELRQNKLMIILAAAAPIFLTIFPIFFSIFNALAGNTGINGVFENLTHPIIRMLMWFLGIFAVNFLMSEVFKNDDKKLWAYFVLSTPGGVKSFIYQKYVITLLINIVYMASGIFTDTLLATVTYLSTGEELTFSMSSMYLSGVFLLMFFNAFDIPFTVRFGSNKGSVIKMISLLSICGAMIGIYLLLPADIAEKLTKAVIDLIKGRSENYTLMIIVNLCPFIAVTAFLLSYKISCKVFVKGVNEYDK